MPEEMPGRVKHASAENWAKSNGRENEKLGDGLKEGSSNGVERTGVHEDAVAEREDQITKKFSSFIDLSPRS